MNDARLTRAGYKFRDARRPESGSRLVYQHPAGGAWYQEAVALAMLASDQAAAQQLAAGGHALSAADLIQAGWFAGYTENEGTRTVSLLWEHPKYPRRSFVEAEALALLAGEEPKS